VEDRDQLLERAIREIDEGRQGAARKSIRQALAAKAAPAQQVANSKAPSTLHDATALRDPSPARPALAEADPRVQRLAKARRAMDDVDESLDSLHDRFAGDAPTQTSQSGAGERRFQEAAPKMTTSKSMSRLATADAPHAETPVGREPRGVRKVAYQNAATAPPTRGETYPKKRSTAADNADDESTTQSLPSARPGAKLNGPAAQLTPQIGWLESQSVPMGANPNDPRQTAGAQGAVDWNTMGRNPRLPTPPGIPAQFQQDQKPGFIKRSWNAVRNAF
jgi:hypothetical protein